MELYCIISITDRIAAADVLGICRDLGLSFTLTNLGRGTATSEHLTLNNLEHSEKAVVSVFAGAAEMKRLIHLAKAVMFMDIPGNGIMMAIPVKSVGGAKTLAFLTAGKDSEGGVPDMKFEHELIVVVLNEGYADVVMDAARAAGASGGTVLHAKGTGNKDAVRFFGVSLAEEKEMIYIVSPSSKKAKIMNAVSGATGTDTDAGAFCFSLPISEVAGLRKFDMEKE